LNLPIGMQLIGPQWSEARLLAVGAAYQDVTDFHRRRPPAYA
jgi:aspartyl-tRNA(Asn)/glutamyl-tRNA(Gln) amidotransferase subunit A